MMSLNDYVQEKEIGKGAFGEVCLYRRKHDNLQCVIKQMKIDDSDVRNSAETELKSLCHLKHPNIVEYIACFQESNIFFLVLEYCSGGDLSNRLKQQGATHLPEDKVIKWTFELCMALKHMHDKNIIHRDLKPQNVFLTSDDTVKIGDFGISKLLKPGDLSTMSVVGTPLYISPEIARQLPYDCKTDVWSLGCVVYEMMALKTAVDIFALISRQERLIGKMPTGYSSHLTDLTDRMMTIEAANRPTVADIIAELLPLKVLSPSSVLSEYDQVRQIGSGAFGVAWLYQKKSDKKQFVLKKMSINGQDEIVAAVTETLTHCNLKHQNIVKYIDFFFESNQCCILMEYCEGGDLATKLKNQGSKKLPEATIVQWTLDLCLALEYIHEREIIHRDLKPQNIFLTKDESIKIGDFGIARALQPGVLATTAVGTPLYVSPEIIRGLPYDCKTDVWSLGLCVYEMMALKPAVNILDLLMAGNRIIGPMPTGYSAELTKLTDFMLTIEASDRPTIKDILKSRLFLGKLKAPRLSTHVDLELAIQGLRIECNRSEALTQRQQAQADLLALGYVIDGKSKLVDSVRGSAYTYSKTGNKQTDEQHYQDVAKALTAYVQATLQIDFNMSKLYLPIDAKPDEEKTFIFISNDYRANSKKLMMMIQGNGYPRAGEWARKVMINDSLDAGSQIRWVERAYKEGFSVILLNPNEGVKEIDGKEVAVRENESSFDHVHYVWKNVIPISQAKHIAIVAHSFGGKNVVQLASSVVDDFVKRVSVLAFADSVHTIQKTTPKKFIDFCQKHARNWESSDDPLDKPVKTAANDIPCVSAGETRHEWTTWNSFNSIFTFIKSLVP